MKQFINNFMYEHQADKTIEPFKNVFLETVKRVYDTLGSKPFNIKRGINVAVFDSVMVAFARSASTPDDIKRRFRTLLKNPSYEEAITAGTTAVDTVKRRIKLAQEILFG